MTTLKALAQWTVVLGLIFSVGPAWAKGPPELLVTQRDKVNYAIGVNLIGNFKQQGVDIDLDLVVQGMKDAAAGEKLLLNEEEIRNAIALYQTKVRQRRPPEAAKTAAANKTAGEAFLAANKKKAGVVTLASGLQYTIIKAGDGRKPTLADTVECRYRGLFINGNEFESSSRSEQTPTFKVAEVIPGWREALQLMPAGSKWQLFVPPRLAYGDRGKGAAIGPDTTLIYEVELLAIK